LLCELFLWGRTCGDARSLADYVCIAVAPGIRSRDLTFPHQPLYPFLSSPQVQAPPPQQYQQLQYAQPPQYQQPPAAAPVAAPAAPPPNPWNRAPPPVVGGLYKLRIQL
jgi:hypothetical protein